VIIPGQLTDEGEIAMSGIKVSTQFGGGFLTNEHAASSYGLPVVILGCDGSAVGPAEAGVVDTPCWDETQTEELALCEAARRAGYRIYN
jgi:hypothetical protein